MLMVVEKACIKMKKMFLVARVFTSMMQTIDLKILMFLFPLDHTESNSITLKEGCWVGANILLLSGVTIGKNVVVVAGAAVTKYFEDFVVESEISAKHILMNNE